MAPKLITPDKKILLTEGAKREVEEAGSARIDAHLQVFGQQRSVFNQDLDMVVKVALQTRGLPFDEKERGELLKECVAFATELSTLKLRTYNEGVRELINKFGVTDVPDEVKWAASRVGVQLLDDSPAH